MYVLYVRYVRSSRTLHSLRSTLCNLGYHSSSHSSIGSILDHAYISQLAFSNSSPSSCSIVLKASVTYGLLEVYRREYRPLRNPLSLTPLNLKPIQTFYGNSYPPINYYGPINCLYRLL
jgi:hypothetical protein